MGVHAGPQLVSFCVDGQTPARVTRKSSGDWRHLRHVASGMAVAAIRPSRWTTIRPTFIGVQQVGIAAYYSSQGCADGWLGGITIRLQNRKQRAAVAGLWVDPAVRRKGIATHLLVEALLYLQSNANGWQVKAFTPSAALPNTIVNHFGAKAIVGDTAFTSGLAWLQGQAPPSPLYI